MFSDGFSKKFVEHSNYQKKQHKKIDESKDIKHDDVCDCNSTYYDFNGIDPVLEYLKPHNRFNRGEQTYKWEVCLYIHSQQQFAI